jgi:hypothetical protein
VAVLDVLMVGHVIEAWGTRAYVETGGRILSSVVTTDRRRTHIQHGVAVSYAYAVRGRTFHGRRYAANDPGTSSGSWARDVVATLPVGAPVPVFYAPDDPSQAVLKPGVRGGDLLWLLFLVPFNLMTVGSWWVVTLVARARVQRVPYVEPASGPWVAALVATALAAPISMIAVAIAFGMDPSPRVAEAAWLVTLGVGVGVGWRGRARASA